MFWIIGRSKALKFLPGSFHIILPQTCGNAPSSNFQHGSVVIIPHPDPCHESRNKAYKPSVSVFRSCSRFSSNITWRSRPIRIAPRSIKNNTVEHASHLKCRPITHYLSRRWGRSCVENSALIVFNLCYEAGLPKTPLIQKRLIGSNELQKTGFCTSQSCTKPNRWIDLNLEFSSKFFEILVINLLKNLHRNRVDGHLQCFG